MTEVYPVSDLEHPLHSLVSWPAVIAGAAAAVAIGAMLNLLGIALGAGSFNPYDFSGHNAAGFTVAAGVWVAIANAIALFIGAMIASRAAKYPDLHNGMLHGLIVWATAFLFAIVIAGWMTHGAAQGAAQGAVQGAAQTALAAGAPGAVPPAPGAANGGAASGILQSDGTYLQPDGTVTTADGAVVGHANPPAPGSYSAPAAPVAAPAPAPATPAAQKAVATTAATVGLWAFLTMLLGAVGAVLGGRYGMRRHAWEARLAGRGDRDVDRIHVPGTPRL